MSKYQPGQSGNPSGKPRGALGLPGKMRQALAQEAPAIIEAMVLAAKAGDTTAAGLILSRVIPPLRPNHGPVSLPGLEDASPNEQLRQVIAATAKGELAPDVALALVTMLTATKQGDSQEIDREFNITISDAWQDVQSQKREAE